MIREIGIAFLVMAGPLIAAEDGIQNVEQARNIVKDYEMREKARAWVALEDAIRLVEEHESGRKKANEPELARAREIIRKDNERKSAEHEHAIENTPVLVVLRRDTVLGLGRLLDAANREFMRRRIAELKGDLEENSGNARLRKDLQAWEKALSALELTGKVFSGAVAVTIFEEQDTFVVAYFDNSRTEHFVCSFSKDDYTPLRVPVARERKAVNANQKFITLD